MKHSLAVFVLLAMLLAAAIPASHAACAPGAEGPFFTECAEDGSVKVRYNGDPEELSREPERVRYNRINGIRVSNPGKSVPYNFEKTETIGKPAFRSLVKKLPTPGSASEAGVFFND